MKKLMSILAGLAITCFCSHISNAASSTSLNESEANISFHEVNLVCGAATDIGCGSRSKPILNDLQSESSIKEAWLNRPGTIVAVVWEEGSDQDIDMVTTIFKKHGKSITTLAGEDNKTQLVSFKDDRWYLGDEVDELSMEEAGRISTQILEQYADVSGLTDEGRLSMHKEIEAFIQNEFMTLDGNVELLSSPEYYAGWETEIRKIFSAYVGEEDLPEIQLCSPSKYIKGGKASKSSCTSSTSSKACCTSSGKNNKSSKKCCVKTIKSSKKNSPL